eukprot:scaffold51445_cov17-Tisochrysis_lutea.AAC.1
MLYDFEGPKGLRGCGLCSPEEAASGNESTEVGAVGAPDDLLMCLAAQAGPEEAQGDTLVGQCEGKTKRTELRRASKPDPWRAIWMMCCGNGTCGDPLLWTLHLDSIISRGKGL